ncbi:hypothetical protein KC218_27655, partial [Mycobacterium tuberculosis]|nr:hypothetical protein [Mycobacterium tuberculosis]
PLARLMLEEARLAGVGEALIDGLFGVVVRDGNTHAGELPGRSATAGSKSRASARSTTVRGPSGKAAAGMGAEPPEHPMIT